MIPFLDLKKQNEEVVNDLDQALNRVIKSTKLSLGSELVVFEKVWANYCGARFCIGVGNGYDALRLILIVNNVGVGDKVLVAANTHIATWYAIHSVGAEIVPVEPDYSKSYCLDVPEVDAVLSSIEGRDKVNAILTTQLYGSYKEIEALEAYAMDNGLALYVDACQGHGAYRQYGDAAAYSFYPTKNLGALGDGGAVVTDSAVEYTKLLALRNYGGMVQNEHVYENGINSRLDELQAAFLLVKTRKLLEWNQRRQITAAKYDAAFKGLDMQLPCLDKSVFHQYVVQVDNRDNFRAMMKRNKIETMVHYPTPPHMQPAFSDYKKWSLKATEQMVKRIVSLPIGPELTDEQVITVIDTIKGHSW